MAYQDGIGTGMLGGIRGTAAAVVGSQVTTPYAPHDLVRISTLTAWLTVLVDGPGLSDIQWQVSDDPTFATVDWSLTSTNQSNGLVTVSTSPLTEGTGYFWRTRSAAAGTTAWGDWSVVWGFTPDQGAGRGYAYVDVNVGAALVPEPDVTSVAYVDLNVGVMVTLDADGVHYIDGNVGVEITRKGTGIEYSYVGDVNTATPTPHIWFLRPTSGREGDGIQVVGFGFGDLQSTYDGLLQHRPDGAWENLPITDWQTYLPTEHAYTEDRELSIEYGHIDMQHQIIEFVVPVGAEPPGWPVRVITDGS